MGTTVQQQVTESVTPQMVTNQQRESVTRGFTGNQNGFNRSNVIVSTSVLNTTAINKNNVNNMNTKQMGQQQW